MGGAVLPGDLEPRGPDKGDKPRTTGPQPDWVDKDGAAITGGQHQNPTGADSRGGTVVVEEEPGQSDCAASQSWRDVASLPDDERRDADRDKNGNGLLERGGGNR